MGPDELPPGNGGSKREFDPVGMGFPDPSDFQQSDEHASEYEEEQKIRELLKGKMDPWWKKKRNWKAVGKMAIIIMVVLIPAHIITTIIEHPLLDPAGVISIWRSIFVAVIACLIGYGSLAALAWLINLAFNIPYYLSCLWDWIWED